MISFDLKDFENNKVEAISLFRQLKSVGKFNRTEEIDNFFSKQPSYAFKYVRKVLYSDDKKKMMLSPKNEKVFLKNIKFGIAYLSETQQKSFQDPKIQKRFEDKIYTEPGMAFDYAKKVLKGRLPEDKESVLISDPILIYHYSKDIIKGLFPENIHNKILLNSFQNTPDSADPGATSRSEKDRKIIMGLYIAQKFKENFMQDYYLHRLVNNDFYHFRYPLL